MSHHVGMLNVVQRGCEGVGGGGVIAVLSLIHYLTQAYRTWKSRHHCIHRPTFRVNFLHLALIFTLIHTT